MKTWRSKSYLYVIVWTCAVLFCIHMFGRIFMQCIKFIECYVIHNTCSTSVTLTIPINWWCLHHFGLLLYSNLTEFGQYVHVLDLGREVPMSIYIACVAICKLLKQLWYIRLTPWCCWYLAIHWWLLLLFCTWELFHEKGTPMSVLTQLYYNIAT